MGHMYGAVWGILRMGHMAEAKGGSLMATRVIPKDWMVPSMSCYSGSWLMSALFALVLFLVMG